MAEATPENLGPPAAVAEATVAPEAEKPIDGIDAELDRLPTYARGLLRIRVPVQVTLASQRKSIQEIIELGPGSIIKFDKTCDEPLNLCVGDQPIAQGEVVKVGDKFGLRIGALMRAGLTTETSVE
ncbi:MAG TPA: FliM/FliN family flagellar motor C-terminal domain-containing protein [Lacipirellulaceae bacterium]|nr:FliM/FliN family flagellar motor C-terminal domain-containing protein [Lacipirellulaceae bacterium]